LGISKGERMDVAIQKAVELGVSEIQPLQTEHSVVKLNAERADRRWQHWQGIVINACEQCGRNHLPRLHPVQLYADWLAADRLGAGWLFAPQSEQRLAAQPRPDSGASLLIGPEGGLSEREIDAACQRGFVALNFGPRILRTETAAIACISAVQTLWGDLG
ncbi:MAG: 16S rRNA (uracil(1498)-N(3))-methyltransferase, partial [Gammaproteobacteria bacterium]